MTLEHIAAHTKKKNTSASVSDWKITPVPWNQANKKAPATNFLNGCLFSTIILQTFVNTMPPVTQLSFLLGHTSYPHKNSRKHTLSSE